MEWVIVGGLIGLFLLSRNSNTGGPNGAPLSFFGFAPSNGGFAGNPQLAVLEQQNAALLQNEAQQQAAVAAKTRFSRTIHAPTKASIKAQGGIKKPTFREIYNTRVSGHTTQGYGQLDVAERALVDLIYDNKTAYGLAPNTTKDEIAANLYFKKKPGFGDSLAGIVNLGSKAAAGV